MLWGAGNWGRCGVGDGRAQLSGRAIVATAIAIADRGGLDAVTMRGVGQQLGASGMALYRHVASREMLVELMVDEVVGRFAATGPRPRSWRAALAEAARQEWRTYRTHPWVLAATATFRPPLGPNMLAAMERALASFDGLGLSGVERLCLLGTVTSYGQGLALSWLQDSAAEPDPEAMAAWWRAQLAEAEAGAAEPRYPRLAAVAVELSAGSGVGIEQEFAFGLERVLDGVEAYLRRREAGPAADVKV